MQTLRIVPELNKSANVEASNVASQRKRRVKAERTNNKSVLGKCATKKRTSNFDFVGVAG